MDPEDIKQKEFGRSLFGYRAQEVQAFLEQLSEQQDALRAEIRELRRELAESQGELKDYQGRHETLEATLTHTRETAQEIRTNAEREAELTVAEAELRAEKILNQAHNRLAQIHDDIAELKRQRAQFDVRLRSLIEAHLKLLDVETDRDRDLAELEDKIKILRSPPSSSNS